MPSRGSWCIWVTEGLHREEASRDYGGRRWWQFENNTSKRQCRGFLRLEGTSGIRVQCTASIGTFLNRASGSLWHKDLEAGIRPSCVEPSAWVMFADGQPECTQHCWKLFCSTGEESLGPPHHLMWPRNVRCLWLR